MRLFFYARAYYNYNEIRFGKLAIVRPGETRETGCAHSVQRSACRFKSAA
jgi:hypothetical protein